MDKLTKSDVSFEVDNKPVSFSIVHNLIDVKGLSFEDALSIWLTRTKRFTATSLCNYINSKGVGFYASTEEMAVKNGLIKS